MCDGKLKRKFTIYKPSNHHRCRRFSLFYFRRFCATPSAAPTASLQSTTPKTQCAIPTLATWTSAATCSATLSAAPTASLRSLMPKSRCVTTTRAIRRSAVRRSAHSTRAPTTSPPSRTPKRRCAPTPGAPMTSAAMDVSLVVSQTISSVIFGQKRRDALRCTEFIRVGSFGCLH